LYYVVLPWKGRCPRVVCYDKTLTRPVLAVRRSASHINSTQSPYASLPPTPSHTTSHRVSLSLPSTARRPLTFSKPTAAPTRNPLHAPAQMAKKKRCQFQGDEPCTYAVLRIAGDCPYCKADFCATVSTPFSPKRLLLSLVRLTKSPRAAPTSGAPWMRQHRPLQAGGV
jgi:hypothetical protein